MFPETQVAHQEGVCDQRANDGKMTQGMPAIRFPRSRGSRRARSQPAPPQAPLDVIAQQIRDLDAAAQRAADNVAAAAQRLRGEDSSKRAELTASVADALVDRTAEIRSDCERLASLVSRSANLLAEREGRESTVTEPASVSPPKRSIAPAPVPVEPEPEPIAESEPDEVAVPDSSAPPVPVSASGGTSEGVRLIATQMAIAGSSRAEIEHRLRIQFGVVDASQALDDIFGNRRSGVQ
jgi:hypothetical protein